MTTLSINAGDYAVRSDFLTTLNNFFLGSLSLNGLQEWLLSNLQSILDSNDAVAVEAANEIDADLIALNDKTITEDAFIESVERWINKLQTISISIGELAEKSVSTVAETVSHSFKARDYQDYRFNFRQPVA